MIRRLFALLITSVLLAGCGIFERTVIEPPPTPISQATAQSFFVRADGNTVIDANDGGILDAVDMGDGSYLISMWQGDGRPLHRALNLRVPVDAQSKSYPLMTMAAWTPDTIGIEYLHSWLGATPVLYQEAYNEDITGEIVLIVQEDSSISGSLIATASGYQRGEGNIQMDRRTVEIDAAFVNVPLP